MGILGVLAAVAPTIVKGLAKLFEAKFGPKTGPTKKQSLMEVLLPILDRVICDTGIPVNQDVVSRFIDDVVAELNKAGELSGPSAQSGAMTITGTLEVKR